MRLDSALEDIVLHRLWNQSYEIITECNYFAVLSVIQSSYKFFEFFVCIYEFLSGTHVSTYCHSNVGIGELLKWPSTYRVHASVRPKSCVCKSSHICGQILFKFCRFSHNGIKMCWCFLSFDPITFDTYDLFLPWISVCKACGHDSCIFSQFFFKSSRFCLFWYEDVHMVWDF